MKVIAFLKKEKVFTIAALLAIVSCFFVLPDRQYIDYIDFRTLGLLFSLMLIVQGFADAGVFEAIVNGLLKKVGNARSLSFVLVFICFFLSMLITNDVALITFVPFALASLKAAGLSKYGIRVVVLQTVAANLGSAFTPIGNPQNLYLYSVSGMSFGEFMAITGPLTGASFIVLVLLCVFIPKESVQLRSEKDSGSTANPEKQLNIPSMLLFTLLFIANLLVVFRVVPFIPVVAGTAVLTVVFGKWRLLGKVDYVLLLTFVGFFVFVGNIQRIEVISTFLSKAVMNREILFSAAASQVISNVPAATLLAGFTDNVKGLILGTDIGGLGTPIASMASLISYKLFAAENEELKGKYMKHFLVINFVLLAVFLGVFVGIYQ